MATIDMTARQADTVVFTRHRGPVTCAAVTPGDGRTMSIVSSGYDGAVALTEVSGRRMELLGYHEHIVNRIALSASGRLAASASSDYTVGLWDLQTASLIRFLRGHSDDVEDFAFVSERLGISVSRDRRVLIWDLTTGSILGVLLGHERDVLSVAYCDGQIFTSGDDMTLRSWSLQSGELLSCWGPFEHETDTCAIDVRRRRAVLGCDDGTIRIFSIDGGDSIATIDGHSSGVKVVAVSPRTGDVFSGAYDRRLVVWDAESFAERLVLQPLASAWERSFNWSPDGARICAGTFDGTVVGWSAANGRRLFEIGSEGGNACFNEVSSAGGHVAAVADDGRVRLGRLTPRHATWSTRREPHGGRVLANAVTADASAGIVVAGFHDQTLRVFALEDGLEELAALDLHEGPINSVRTMPVDGGCHIFAACYSGRVVRVTGDGEVLARFDVHDGAVKSLRLLPERQLGVSCSADGSTYSWSLQSGERVMTFPAHTAIVNDLDIDPTEKRIASIGRDFVLNVYSLASGRLLQAHGLGWRSPKSVLFATNDTVIVGDYWGHLVTVSLSDGTTHRRRVAQNGISSLCRHRPGKILASSYDGAILLIDTQTATVVGELREMHQRRPLPDRACDGAPR